MGIALGADIKANMLVFADDLNEKDLIEAGLHWIKGNGTGSRHHRTVYGKNKRT